MPQRSVATNYTFEQQRSEINLLAADFWSHKTAVDNAASTYLKHDGSNDFTGGTLAVPNAFTINSNGGQGTLTISGNLTVTGTTTTVNTTNLDVTDKNITIAKGNTSDATADGAGITIDSGTDITWNFVDAKDAWVSSIGVEATTFLKAPYGHFHGSTVPASGQGVQINAPDANTGQITSYDYTNTAYKELRIKGSSLNVYTGTTNALRASFNSSGLEVQAGDLRIPNDTGKVTIGTSADLQLFHDGGTSTIKNINNSANLELQASSTGTKNIRCYPNAGVTLYWNDQTALYTAEDGNNAGTPTIRVHDDVKFKFGNASDFEIYHAAGGNSYIKEGGAGALVINADDFYLQNNATTTYLRTHSGGAIDLNYNGSKVLETAGGAVKVSGSGIFENVAANEYNNAWAAANGKLALKGDLGGGNYFGWRQKNVAAASVTQANAEKKLPTINDFTYPNSSSGMLIASTSKIGFAAAGESPQYSAGVTMLFDSSGLAIGGSRAFDCSDSVSASTTAKIKILGSGTIGINETSPDNKLHITTTSNVAYDTNTSNTQNLTNALLKLENLDGSDGGGVNNYVGIQFSVANGATSSAQLNYVRTADNSGRFAFKARNGGGSDYPNLMDITSAGRVGINQTGPESSLHVDNKSTGTTEANKRIAGFYKPSASSASDREGYIHLGSWSGHYGVKLGYYNEGASPGYHNSGFFVSTINNNQDITNHTKKLVVTSAGSVLVGTENDHDRDFVVNTGGSSCAYFGMTGTNSGKPWVHGTKPLLSVGTDGTGWPGDTSTHLNKLVNIGIGGGAAGSSATIEHSHFGIQLNGTILSQNGVQSGGNGTGGYRFACQYSGKGYEIATQYATAANGGSNGLDGTFLGWWGADNTFRVNTDGQIKARTLELRSPDTDAQFAKYQVLTGAKQCAGDGAWTELFKIGHSAVGRLDVWSMNTKDGYQYGMVCKTFDVQIIYGNWNLWEESSLSQGQINGGTMNGPITVQYLNTGGSTDYLIRANINYGQGGTPGTPWIYWQFSGASSIRPYNL